MVAQIVPVRLCFEFPEAFRVIRLAVVLEGHKCSVDERNNSSLPCARCIIGRDDLGGYCLDLGGLFWGKKCERGWLARLDRLHHLLFSRQDARVVSCNPGCTKARSRLHEKRTS